MMMIHDESLVKIMDPLSQENQEGSKKIQKECWPHLLKYDGIP
jgi:hypothetical protein